MNVLKKNIVANYGGSFWSSLMGLVFVPLYIHFLGIEAYGLIGIFATLLGLFSLLDMGLSATLSREMARLSVLENKAQEMRDLLRTLEILYWGIAGLISIMVVMLSPLIAYHWVSVKALSPVSVQRAISIMGISIAFQWPLGFYSGGLMGLQRQVLLNGISAVMVTCRGVGAVLILWLVSPTVEAFFTWQIAGCVIHTGLVTFFLWHSLPEANEKPHFRYGLLKNIWRFAAGVTGISLTSIFLTQSDKIILTKLLTLEMFGFYTLAGTVVSAMNRFFGPIYFAIYPRFTQLASLRDEVNLAQLYHKACQCMSIIILPLAMVMVFFAPEILLLWTRNPSVVTNAYRILSLLAIGTGLNGLMQLPTALCYSYGCTRPIIYQNIVAIVVIVPMIFFLTTQYGVVGAPIAWIVYNFGLILIFIHVVHSRFLKGEKWRWYLTDVGKPFVVALVAALLWRISIPTDISRISMLVLLPVVSLTILAATAIVTPVTRFWIVHTLTIIFRNERETIVKK